MRRGDETRPGRQKPGSGGAEISPEGPAVQPFGQVLWRFPGPGKRRFAKDLPLWPAKMAVPPPEAAG